MDEKREREIDRKAEADKDIAKAKERFEDAKEAVKEKYGELKERVTKDEPEKKQ